jgi:hypothetical protein
MTEGSAIGLMTCWPGHVVLTAPEPSRLGAGTGTSGGKSPRTDEGDGSRTLGKRPFRELKSC